MASVNPGVGGRGVAVSIERKEHPNSHFEIGSMNIDRAHDGSYVIKHHLRLKKKHEGKEEFFRSYREPETHTAADSKELMAHVQKHFGGAKTAPAGNGAPGNEMGDTMDGSEKDGY